MGEHFRKFAAKTAHLAGSPGAFLLAVAVVVVWAISGPFLHFSEIWQLTINTGTTIVTFLMVFLIQNAQNRDSRAVHLKLDELLRATADARNNMIDLENLSDDDLQHLQDTFQKMREDDENPLADHADDLVGAIDQTRHRRTAQGSQRVPRTGGHHESHQHGG